MLMNCDLESCLTPNYEEPIKKKFFLPKPSAKKPTLSPKKYKIVVRQKHQVNPCSLSPKIIDESIESSKSLQRLNYQQFKPKKVLKVRNRKIEEPKQYFTTVETAIQKQNEVFPNQQSNSEKLLLKRSKQLNHQLNTRYKTNKSIFPLKPQQGLFPELPFQYTATKPFISAYKLED